MIFGSVCIGSDHGGFDLKTALLQNFQMVDLGTDSKESVDYPVYAKRVAEYVVAANNACGVLVCKSGIGMSIAANKFAGIRAFLCTGDLEMTKLSRQHNDCNIICFGADFIDTKLALECLNIFVNSVFEGGRHLRRVLEMERFLIN